MRRVGKLDVIFRHPVKSMRGERIASSQVDAFGLYGDRSYYYLDQSRPGKFLSADRVPQLLGYQAKLTGEPKSGAYPMVQITSPVGKIYSWEDESLHKEIEEVAKRSITPVASTPDKGGENYEDHVLLVTDASLRKLASLWGKEPLDPRRFRGNLIIALDNELPFLEEEWFGKRIQINDAILQITKHCERCMYINIDPTDISIDPTLLKTVAKERNVNFGVYASVVQPGTVQENDVVYLL